MEQQLSYDETSSTTRIPSPTLSEHPATRNRQPTETDFDERPEEPIQFPYSQESTYRTLPIWVADKFNGSVAVVDFQTMWIEQFRADQTITTWANKVSRENTLVCADLPPLA